MSSGGLYSIDKLDDDNYDGWKVQMRSVLVHCDLWSYVSGAIVKPEAGATTGLAVADWNSKDGKALATVLLSVKSSQLLHVKNCTSSASAWCKLEEVHSPRGPARKVTLFKQLLNLKMVENSSMSQHLNNYFDLFEKLIEVDIKLQDELVAIILLSSLPKEYENFVIAIESRDELPKVNVLKTKLIEEGKRREGSVVQDSGEMAFFAKQRKPPSHSQGRTVRGKCYKCNKKGHYAASCRSQSTAPTKTVASFAMLNAIECEHLNKNVWVLDSGTTSHMCCDKNLFVKLTSHTEKIELAADNFIESVGIGDVLIETKTIKITLCNVLFVPLLKTNFLSMSVVTDKGYTVDFNNKSAVIRDAKLNKIICAEKTNNLFLFTMNSEKEQLFSMQRKTDSSGFIKWHERYGHLNAKSLSNLNQNNMVRGLNLVNTYDSIDCEICLKGKISTLPFPKCSDSKSRGVLNLIHSDICGPMRTASLGGFKYFALFIDDFSRKIFVYFLKNKSDVFNSFKIFKAQVELETGSKIKVLRTDNGGEYSSTEFSKFLMKEGIQRQLTVPFTPQQNGVAERANRTIVEMVRCMLMSSNLPESLWGEAVNMAVYLRNRSPTKILKAVTPYEAWAGKKPAVDHFIVFGCKAVMLDKTPSKSKLKPKGIECFMVGYSTESKAYRLYEPMSRKIHKSRDVKFLEHSGKNTLFKNSSDYVILDSEIPKSTKLEVMHLKRHSSSSDEELFFDDANEDIDVDVTDIDPIVAAVEDPDVVAIKNPVNLVDEFNVADINNDVDVFDVENHAIKSGRVLRPRKQNSSKLNYFCKAAGIIHNPLTVAEALNRNDGRQWMESMNAEFKSIMKNDTWELVDLPENRHAIKSKWVFNVKYDKEGNVLRFKSRLVAKGCSQKYGVDYFESFSPVVRYSSLRILLALAVEYDLHVHQMDVTSAYLNGILGEEVYMIQPEKFVDKNHPQKVCKLKKALYGLKQAGREWNVKLDSVLCGIGFKRCKADTCVYTMNINNEINLVAVYVDDIMFACSSREMLHQIKYQIGLEFDVIDKGPIDHFLGMEVSMNTNNQICIGQQQFIRKLLEDFDMVNTRKCNTPLVPGQKFKRCIDCSSCDKTDIKQYQSLIGSLMYLGISTRPDIIHSISKLAQFNANPHMEHIVAAKHVLRYLSNTINFKICYRKTGEPLKAFADADWAGCCDDRKSYTGFVFFIAGASVTWESKKQQSIALSSTEAEYMALSTASKEVVYLRSFLNELGFLRLIDGPTELHGDNLSSQQLVKNPIYHARSKHIDIRVHYIRDVYNKNVIVLKYTPTGEMIADILTKNLSKVKHAELSLKLGLLN